MIALIAAAMLALPATVGRAQEVGIDKAKADAFDVRMFVTAPGKKAYACFVRRYDPDHLARHPKQKVSAMKLLVTAEIPSAAASIAMAAASAWPCRKTTSPPSSGLSGFASGKTTSPTRKPAIHWSPAPMTRSSGWIGSIRVNAHRW
jgi:hypothetical protein